jgi:hypothetical protein
VVHRLPEAESNNSASFLLENKWPSIRLTDGFFGRGNSYYSKLWHIHSFSRRHQTFRQVLHQFSTLIRQSWEALSEIFREAVYPNTRDARRRSDLSVYLLNPSSLWSILTHPWFISIQQPPFWKNSQEIYPNTRTP